MESPINNQAKQQMSLESHSAPGANAGFSFQFERALFWLSQLPAGSAVGIETDDDVAIRDVNGTNILEQDKHSIREKGEPFGDRSKDLWNTLAIWIEAVETKEVEVATTRFLMVTNKLLPDCIAKQISRAESDDDAKACISALESAAEKPPKHLDTFIRRVLRKDSSETLKTLILKCELFDAGAKSAGVELRKTTVGHLQLPQWCACHSESIMDELLGWIHQAALSAWQRNCPAWIQRDNFVNQLHAIIDRRKRQLTRERAEHLIPVADEKIGQQKARPFVKQLHLVSDDEGLVDTAIREFIRCNIEKSRLSAEGNITDEDWKTFETALQSRWEKIRARVMRMKQASPEAEIGFEILTDTTESHREKLAGTETEQVYLTAGTYHRLADLFRLGWHPRFAELMKDLIKTP